MEKSIPSRIEDRRGHRHPLPEKRDRNTEKRKVVDVVRRAIQWIHNPDMRGILGAAPLVWFNLASGFATLRDRPPAAGAGLAAAILWDSLDGSALMGYLVAGGDAAVALHPVEARLFAVPYRTLLPWFALAAVLVDSLDKFSAAMLADPQQNMQDAARVADPIIQGAQWSTSMPVDLTMEMAPVKHVGMNVHGIAVLEQ